MNEKMPPVFYEIKAELQEVSPPIWRRIRVRSDLTLRTLHHVLQTAMGWTNSHLHQFIFEKDRCYGRPDPDGGEIDWIDDSKVRLSKVLAGKGHCFTYQYDFGDSWDHTLTVEGVFPIGDERAAAICVAGARACPPEDVGGTGGYEEFLEVIADPEHAEHKNMLRWAGGAFDPEAFDLNRINRQLQSLIRPSRRAALAA
jgi:hypothetical protein